MKKTKNKILALWLLVFSPLFILALMLALAGLEFFGDLPKVEDLDNPQNNLATEIYTDDQMLLGKFFFENRQECSFEEISPNVISALISTEDERFFEHAGIDAWGLLRAVAGLGKMGGASTITQQLSKMLFTKSGETNKIKRIRDKFKEWIISVQLERRYTKEEILTMYLNRFDFLHNAVGIKSAARIYFGKLPSELNPEEAAVLVGLAKNPRLYNPVLYPLKALERRNVVLHQWFRNSSKESDVILPLSEQDYIRLKNVPIALNFVKESHEEGMAPFFREILRAELKELLESKDEFGNLLYLSPKGRSYDLYNDGLKIYTTLDSRIQQHAEWAMQEHLKRTLQKEFYADTRGRKNWPYDEKTTDEVAQSKIQQAINESDRYKVLVGKLCPICNRPASYISEENEQFVCHGDEEPHIWEKKTPQQISKILRTPVKMRVFAWNAKGYERDTMLSPLDSIKYYKAVLQAGIISIEPKTGYVKAWAGGHNFKYFKYDHVKQTKRQTGSIFKPFVYATMLRDKEGTITPCTEVLDKEYCIDVNTKDGWQSWCPKSDNYEFSHESISLKYAFANSLNPVTVWVMSQTTPLAVIKLVREMGINTKNMAAYPAIALGVFDANLLEMTGAFTTFANNGVFIKPTYIKKIEDKNGNVIFRTERMSKTALDEKTTFLVLDMLKGTMRGVYSPNKSKFGGTGMRIYGSETEERPYAGISYNTVIAGKTGTSQSNSDSWFVGLTPDLVTGVWVGCEDRNVRFGSTQFGQGANASLPMFGYLMKKIYADPSLSLSFGDFEISQKYLPCDQQKQGTVADKFSDEEFDD